MRTVLYYERQHFSPWFHGLALLFGVLGLYLIVPDLEGTLEPVQGLVAILFLGIGVVMLNLFTMTTWVYPEEIRIQFGRLLPYYQKHLALGILERSTPVDYHPLRDAGGWGIRRGTFEGMATRFLNARGARGVLVEGGEQPYLIGTQYPDELDEVLSRRIAEIRGVVCGPADAGDGVPPF